MDSEKLFKEYARFCNKARKPNLFKKIKAKTCTSKKGEVYVRLSLVGFPNFDVAENFGKIIASLLWEENGYSTNWENWLFVTNQSEKTIKLAPIDYWEKYHDAPNYAGHFIKFPDSLGFHFDDNMSFTYSMEFDEAVSILTNLSLKRIIQ